MEKNRLKEIRQAKGLSQFDLYEKTKIKPSQISNIENGKLYFYPGWRKRIAEALEVSEKDLFIEG